MLHLLPWPTSSGKATWFDFALHLWKLGREPSRRPPAFTSVWDSLVFLPAVAAGNRGHHSWDEGNFNQRTSARGNGGMCGVTLPPCGELPLEMNEERWLTTGCGPSHAARTPRCCMPLAGWALEPLLWLNGPPPIAVTSPPRDDTHELPRRFGDPTHEQHQAIALEPGFADLILKFCIDAANMKQDSGPRPAFSG